MKRARNGHILWSALALAAATGLGIGASAGCGLISSIASGRAPTSSDIKEAGEVSKDAADVGMSAAEAMKSLTPENEYYIGRSVATHILAKYDYAYLDRGADWAGGDVGDITRYVNEIGVALGAVVESHPKDNKRPSPLAGYHFVVLDEDQPNAFAAPGGYVFITRGTVQLAENEDELANVLAHELAHVALGHGLKAIKKSRWGGVSKKVLSKASKYTAAEIGALTDAFSGAMDDMVDSLTTSGYEPKFEYGADEYGVFIAARAGYDPNGMKTFLEKLAERTAAEGKGEGYGKTHPDASERIKRVEKSVAKAVGKYGTGSPKARRKRFDATVASL